MQAALSMSGGAGIEKKAFIPLTIPSQVAHSGLCDTGLSEHRPCPT